VRPDSLNRRPHLTRGPKAIPLSHGPRLCEAGDSVVAMAIEIESCLIDVLMRQADRMTRCFVCRLLGSYSMGSPSEYCKL